MKKLVYFVFALLVTGCDDSEVEVKIKQPVVAKDVQFFLDHADDRKSTLKACSNNPGTFKDNPNCINANAAQQKSMKRGGTTSF